MRHIRFPDLSGSDGVLNPSGVRFGSSEIYGVMEKFPDLVQDSICVGHNHDHLEEVVVLFVKTREGVTLTKQVENLLRKEISAALSPRHVPKIFHQVSKIPYNVNGKKLEIAVKRVLAGKAIDDKMQATLADARDLDEFRHFTVTAGLKARL